MNIANTTKYPAFDYETETVTHFISQCPANSQIRADYFHTYHSNTEDIINKQSHTRIVECALKQGTSGFFAEGGGGHFEVKEGHPDCLQIT